MKKESIGLLIGVLALCFFALMQPASRPVEPKKTAPVASVSPAPTKPAKTTISERSERAQPSTNSPPAQKLEPLEYAPRPGGEWQGMLVEKNIKPPCEESARCGLGRACVEGFCVACQQDSQCAPGEACVLDHCVQSENVHCRSKKDCGDRELCILTGYAATPRGTDGMLSQCSGSQASVSEKADAPPPAAEVEPRVFPADELAARARAILAAKNAAKNTR